MEIPLKCHLPKPENNCPFFHSDSDNWIQCTLYDKYDWDVSEKVRYGTRYSRCLADHPHGAMVIIQNKEENPVTVKVVIHEAEDELTTHGGPNEAVTMYETFECQMFVPEGEYYLIPKKDEEEP